MAYNPFTRHPRDVGETYGEHFAMASCFGIRMLGGGIAALVHAVCPFLFERTGSRTLDTLHRRIRQRAEKPNWERHPII